MAGGRTTAGVILAIETSCDETCAAVVTHGPTVRSSIVASQDLLHAPFGGVVPEVASRRHLETLPAVVARALAEAGTSVDGLDAVAVTVGPGLIGALLVGVAAAKGYAYAAELPLIPVDHLAGHIASVGLGDDGAERDAHVCLLVSGGHSLLLDVVPGAAQRLLGTTLDDAAGEAFDKGARLLGLGYPGGRAIEQAAVGGDPEREAFTVPMVRRDGYDLSFSGLKTALALRVRDLGPTEIEDRRADLCAAYQEAIVASLVQRVHAAAIATGRERIAVVGGVAANGILRARLADIGTRDGIAVRFAPLRYCGDNAAMIGAAALTGNALAFPAFAALDAYARSPIAGGMPATA